MPGPKRGAANADPAVSIAIFSPYVQPFFLNSLPANFQPPPAYTQKTYTPKADEGDPSPVTALAKRLLDAANPFRYACFQGFVSHGTEEDTANLGISPLHHMRLLAILGTGIYAQAGYQS